MADIEAGNLSLLAGSALMAEAVRLTLDDLPPSANKIWRAVNGRVLKSAEYRSWLDAMAWSWREQAGSQRVHGKYALTITIGKPDKRRRDLDNSLKALSDLLVHSGLVEDDSLCQRIDMAWGDEPGVKVWIISTDAEEDQ